MFGLEFLSALDPAALTSAAGKTVLTDSDCSGYCVDNSADYVGSGGDLLGDGKIFPAQEATVDKPQMLCDSSECCYFSCDNSADYIGTGSNGETNLTGDGVIYPKYEAFAATGKTPMLSDSSECSYYSCDNSADYIGSTSNGADTNLTSDGTIYPAQEAAVGKPQMLCDSSECCYFSCDNSADYIGTGSNGADTNLTGDGVIYPKYEAFAATGKTPMLSDSSECSYYSCDNSADYIGSYSNGADTHLTSDGTIYPGYSAFQAPGGETVQLSDCTGYECDNSADYVGTPPEGLTGDGAIYPKYTPLSGAVSHMQGLVEEADHSGAFYCPDAQETGTGVDCPLEVEDPVLIPIKYPVIMANQVAGSTQLAAPVHDGAYYCAVPEADCGGNVPDVVLKPIQYPVFSELAPPAAPAAPEFEARAPAKAARSSPAHLLLMGHACLFGAAEATSKLAGNVLSGSENVLAAWEKDFKASSAKAATAVSPAGAAVLGKVMEAK